ncbi:MAG: DNA polymerase III subunit delta, partial [Gammaproteobacteria bacterium]|nr:DNA polymerase III subunit delta [Gammaproteobacteria bacterium]
KKSLRPIYLLSGDEPLQLMEAGDLITATARKTGFTEKEIYHVERSFDWGELFQAANTLSLFAEKKIIDLRFTSCKPGDKGSKALIEYCNHLSDDNLLIIRMPKMDKTAQNSKWFKAIDQVAAVIQVWPVEIGDLPGWIQQRAKANGINFSPEAVQLLADKVEGNLLAAAQEIEKLALNDNKNIGVEDMMETIAEATRFDVFKLTEAVLSGNPARVSKILFGLKASGEEPVLILWALSNEIRTLIKISAKLGAGKQLPAIFKEERVWNKRQALVKTALQRLRGRQLSECLKQAMQVDRIIKGISVGNAWDGLLDLSLMMSGRQLLKVHNE